MGEVTPFLDLYKPAETELVEVENHLNDNYDKIDAGFVSLDGRVGAAEAASGINTFQDYTCDIRDAAGALALLTTFNHARYFKAGNNVTLDIVGTITNWNAATSAPKFKLPYRAEVGSGASNIVYGFGHLHSNVGTASIYNLALFINNLSSVTREYLQSGFMDNTATATLDPSDSIPYPAANQAYFRIYATYITNGDLL